MTRKISRRTLLKVAAATAALPLGIVAFRSFAGAPEAVVWHGESLDGPVSLSLWHPDPAFARATILHLVAEVGRLEAIFSLNRSASEISRLNREAALDSPSSDLVLVLDEARRIAQLSDGAFDPTVQALWQLYVEDPTPDARALDTARARIDHTRIAAHARRIALPPAMAITLNGIAQGYITDRIANLLREQGFEHAMVELGETRALGAAPDGRPFAVHLRNPLAPDIVDRTVEIADQSLAVSGGYGFRFAGSNAHHIFDPATGRSAQRLLDVTIIAPRAVSADALSTAIYVSGEAAAPKLLAAYPGARALLTRLDGTTITI